MNSDNQEQNITKKYYIPKKDRLNNTDKKKYEAEYFKNIAKQRIRYCDICIKEIKYNSFTNHNKSKLHNTLVKIQEASKENPLIVDM